MRESVLPVLIALVSNGNRVLASAGRDTLPTIFLYCHFDGMLKVIAQTIGESRHASVRHSCLGCLLHALQYWPTSVLGVVGGLLDFLPDAHRARRRWGAQVPVSFLDRCQIRDSAMLRLSWTVPRGPEAIQSNPRHCARAWGGWG